MVKVAITGATGLVGSRLTRYLRSRDYETLTVSRGGKDSEGVVYWNPAAGEIDAVGLEGCDAVVHLAGENIAGRRWSEAQKTRIRDSRVQGTQLLCQTLANLEYKPAVLVSASAIGYYGDRGDYICDETASCGTGFLPDVCVAWEAATEAAVRAGIRVVNLRIAMVLSREGGALGQMLLPFRLGLGGVVGSGRQYYSWITLDDLVRAIEHCLQTEALRGPVNAAAPAPVTNREFTKTLGKVLHRPTVLPMPAFAARLAFGELADALLLASCRVIPPRLSDTGFQFESPDLESGLRQVLQRP